MGVRSLETYLEKESRHSCYRVDIKRLVHEYRLQTGSEAVVVVDGWSCLFPLYENSHLSWLNGGQFKEFHHLIQKFINSFVQLGCRIVAFFDGPVQDLKISEWKRRRLDSGKQISAIFKKLHKGCQFIEQKCWCPCLPYGIGFIFVYLLSQHDKCSVVTSIRECDEEVARYAAEHNSFAILAQDTDYVIFRGARHYLSAKHLDLDAMTTLCYDGVRLSTELGIPPSQLPLLASLVGNDLIGFDQLKRFHSGLKQKSSSGSLVSLVAEYMRGLTTCDLGEIAAEVFGSSDLAHLLINSVNSYDLARPLDRCIEEEWLGETDASEWSKITQLARKKTIEAFHPSPLYDIVVLLRYYRSACLEDYGPDNDVHIGNILRELRRSSYGVLLHEKPAEEGKQTVVMELVMTGPDSLEREVPVSPKYLSKASHPGLLKLWTCRDLATDTCRWEIVGEIFQVDVEEARRVPDCLLVPVLATRYLRRSYPDMLMWELHTLIATNVCVRNYSCQDLARLPQDELTYRSIWLYTAISRTYEDVCDLLYYLGHPVPPHSTAYHNFTDGKLYHSKYRLASRGAPSRVLCDNQDSNFKLFNMMKSFIMS